MNFKFERKIMNNNEKCLYFEVITQIYFLNHISILLIIYKTVYFDRISIVLM